MKKHLKKIGMSAALLVVGTLAPTTPQAMTPLYSYRYPADEVRPAYIPGTYSTSTDSGVPNPELGFKDDDGDGFNSVAVFENSKGQDVYQQIPDTQYVDMTKKGGAAFNPTKTELVSLLEVTTQKAQAAIAFDTSSTAHVSATSATFSHTVNSADEYLSCGVAPGNNVDNITGVTYNAVSLTQLQLATPDAFTVSHQYLFGLALPSTGTNNVVVSRSASGDMRIICMGHSGASYDNSGVERLDATGTYSATSTLAALTGWAITYCGWQRTPTFSIGITQRQVVDDNAYKAGDSNGTITSPYSMTCTGAINPGDNSAVWLVLGPPVAAAAGTPMQSYMLIQDYEN
jgi:hypothetical protein